MVAGDGLSVDCAGKRTQTRQRLDNEREALSQVVSPAAVQLHPWPILAGDDPEAVMLDLGQPNPAGRQLWRFRRQAGLDEPGW
jgi:hypothetical protein